MHIVQHEHSQLLQLVMGEGAVAVAAGAEKPDQTRCCSRTGPREFSYNNNKSSSSDNEFYG